MDIRQPTEKEMIEGIALGIERVFLTFLKGSENPNSVVSLHRKDFLGKAISEGISKANKPSS